MLQFFGVAREYLIINPIKLQIHQLGFDVKVNLNINMKLVNKY